MSNFNLPDTITYWSPASVDGNNAVTYSLGISIDARWAEVDGTTTDDKGKVQATTLAVYARTLIPKRARIALGDFSRDANPAADARVVINTKANRSMSDMFKMML